MPVCHHAWLSPFWLTKAPCGGDVSGPSPTDRGKLGIKRSTLVDADGLPLGVVSAPANRHDSPLLAPTLDLLKDTGGPHPHLRLLVTRLFPDPDPTATVYGCAPVASATTLIPPTQFGSLRTQHRTQYEPTPLDQFVARG